MSVPISARPLDLTGDRAPARREWAVFARRLARRRTALFGLIVVTVVVVAALGAPWLAQYDPIEQDITNRLRPPGALDTELAASAPLPQLPANIPVSDPTTLLRQRPDIRAAEWRLVSKNALVGERIADRR